MIFKVFDGIASEISVSFYLMKQNSKFSKRRYQGIEGKIYCNDTQTPQG